MIVPVLEIAPVAETVPDWIEIVPELLSGMGKLKLPLPENVSVPEFVKVGAVPEVEMPPVPLTVKCDD